jgi:xylulokinase
VSFCIGVDIGSQSVKGVLLDPEGRVVATAGQPCRMAHPRSGWAEQDPLSWERGLAEVVRRLLDSGPAGPHDVGHLALACQVDGVVPVDTRIEPLRDAIIWLDRRAAGQAAELAARVGDTEAFEITGLNVDASHTAPKIMWLRDEEPHVFRAARAMPPVAAFVVGRLTGVLAQDPANASSSLLYDVASGGWSDRMLDAAGIDPGRLAPVRPAVEVAGTLTPEAARLLGLPEGCQVLVGTGDDHAASIGAGAIRPGVIADITGTAEPVTVTSERLVLDPGRMVETHAHGIEDLLLVENPGFVSGGSTLWLAQSVLGVEQRHMFDRAAEAPAGADGVGFLPALSGSMTPRWNSDMRGAFTGLSMNHDGRHLARAVLEGCAFALRDIVDRLHDLGLGGDSGEQEIRVVGGGARSPLWLQIKADVIGRPVRPVLAAEATATGAAILAGLAAGTFGDIAEATTRAVEVAAEPVRPDPGTRELYDAAYARYRATFDAVEKAAV